VKLYGPAHTVHARRCCSPGWRKIALLVRGRSQTTTVCSVSERPSGNELSSVSHITRVKMGSIANRGRLDKNVPQNSSVKYHLRPYAKHLSRARVGCTIAGVFVLREIHGEPDVDGNSAGSLASGKWQMSVLWGSSFTDPPPRLPRTHASRESACKTESPLRRMSFCC
jgi:hypothetical protein